MATSLNPFSKLLGKTSVVNKENEESTNENLVGNRDNGDTSVVSHHRSPKHRQVSFDSANTLEFTPPNRQVWKKLEGETPRNHLSRSSQKALDKAAELRGKITGLKSTVKPRSKANSTGLRSSHLKSKSEKQAQPQKSEDRLVEKDAELRALISELVQRSDGRIDGHALLSQLSPPRTPGERVSCHSTEFSSPHLSADAEMLNGWDSSEVASWTPLPSRAPARYSLSPMPTEGCTTMSLPTNTPESTAMTRRLSLGSCCEHDIIPTPTTTAAPSNSINENCERSRRTSISGPEQSFSLDAIKLERMSLVGTNNQANSPAALLQDSHCNFLEVCTFGVDLSGMVPLDLGPTQVPSLLDIYPESNQGTSIVGGLGGYCFPHGVPLRLLSSVEAKNQINRQKSPATHILQFSDAFGKPTFGAVVVVDEVVPFNSLFGYCDDKTILSLLLKLRKMEAAATVIKRLFQRIKCSKRAEGTVAPIFTPLKALNEKTAKTDLSACKTPREAWAHHLLNRTPLEDNTEGLYEFFSDDDDAGSYGSSDDDETLSPGSIAASRRCSRMSSFRGRRRLSTSDSIRTTTSSVDDDNKKWHAYTQRCYVMLSDQPLYSLMFSTLHEVANNEKYSLGEKSAKLAREAIFLSNKMARDGFLKHMQGLNPSYSGVSGTVMVKYPEYLDAAIRFTTPSVQANDLTRLGDAYTAAYREWLFAAFFHTIPPQVVLQLHTLLLLEKSVVVLSKSASLATTISTALLYLIQPLQWAGCFVPLVTNDTNEILQAPVPFIAGTTTQPRSLEHDISPAAAVLFVDDYFTETSDIEINKNITKYLKSRKADVQKRFLVLPADDTTSALVKFAHGPSGQQVRLNLMNTAGNLRGVHSIDTSCSNNLPPLTMEEAIERTSKYALCLSKSEKQCVQQGLSHLHELTKLFLGPENIDYTAYGSIASVDDSYQFRPDLFLAPLKMRFQLQEACSRTQLFVSYMESSYRSQQEKINSEGRKTK